MADFLSRLQNSGEIVPVEDSFLDENLFAISIVDPWYADLANYLSTGKTPPHFNRKEKKRLIKQSARYSWINGDLFYTGYDMGILQPRGQHSRFSTLATIGHLFLKIPRGM